MSNSSIQLQSRRWKLAGFSVLVAGLAVAGVVYWLGIRAADLADEPSMQSYYKAETHQVGVLYGKEGILIDDIFRDLKKPGAQAFLIIASSVVIAAGCYLFAKFPDKTDEKDLWNMP